MFLFDLVLRLVRAVLSLALAYARPALALVLLVAPIVCTLLTLDTGASPVAACCILAVWGLVMAMHALPRDPTRTAEVQPDGVSESILLGLAGVKTLQILHDTMGAHDQTLWAIVILAALASVTLKHIDDEWVNPRSRYTRVTVPAEGDIDTSRSMPPQVTLVMLGLVATSGLLRAIVFTPSGSDMTTSTLVLAETVVCIWLMVHLYLRGVTTGLEESMLGMLYLHACVFPIMDLGSVGGILHLAVLGLMLLMTFVATAQIDPRAKMLEVPWAVVEAVAELGVRLMASTSVWQVVVLVSFGVVVRALGQVWYTAHADFPDFLRDLAQGALDLIARGPKLFMELTNRPEVQSLMVEVVPEISAPRGLIYRILAPIMTPFEQGRDGIDYTLLPLYEFFAMLAFTIGPFVAALGVLVQIFGSGAAFAKSRWFWAFCAWGCLLFAMLTQVVAGPKVAAVALVFIGASYKRSYSEEGQYALLGLLVLCGACLVLFVILSQTESDSLRLLKQSQAGLGARFSLSASRVKVVPRLVRPKRSLGEIGRRGLARLGGLLVSPAFVLAVVGVGIIVVASLAQGSPVSIEVKKIKTLSDEDARWLKITDLDRVAAVESTFIGFLVQVFGSDVRLAFLLRYLVSLVVSQVQCLPCLCIPGVSEVGGAFTAVGSALSSGFHLLESRPIRAAYDESSYLVNGTYAQSPLRRRTLFSFDPSVQCSRPSNSCNGAAICISDIVDPIVDVVDFLTGLLTQGLKEAVRLLVEQVMNYIPGFSAINDIFGDITLLNQFEGFDPLDYASFSTIPSRLLGVVFGALSNLHFPAFASLRLSTTWLVIVILIVVGVLVLLLQLGLFEPLVDSAFTTVSVTVALGFLAGLVGLVFLGYELVTELRNFGWEVHTSFNKVPLAWDTIGLGLIIVSCCLVVGSASAIELEKAKVIHDEQKQAQVQQQRRLPPAVPKPKKRSDLSSIREKP